MSNFTSPFISTANIGSWDYYIFSDNVGIWRSLNGLAAWFNSSGQLLQGAAWLGSLIILCMALFGATVQKSTISGGVLGTWFFFMTMMGITGQANVYNIYTNQVTVVQNIPALALVPASVFSKAAFKVFTSMDTAFQGVNGSYMSVSQFGFIGPLDLLLSLRSPKMTAVKPALTQTLSQVVHDCALDPNASGNVPSLSKALDMLNWLTMYGRSSGLTRIFTESDASGTGTTVACKNDSSEPQVMIEGLPYNGGIDYINRQYENMASGSTELMQAVNADTTHRNPINTQGLWTSSSLQNSYDMLIGSAIGMNQTAVQFTKNALVASTITYTMDCLSQSGALTTPETCAVGSLAMANSLEKWKTDSAMAGSGFLKTMFTSMGVLQALFFALFPVIAIYGLVVPMKTGKVFGGFIFFGIWCQSWLLTVAPVQSYIQTSIVDEMSKIMSGTSGMTLANTMAVYQSLSTKLAIAGDIMASSQMLSLALLSGSMVALSGLAGKWSGEQHMDSSKLQHDVSKSSALVDHKPMNSVSSITTNSNGGMASLNNKTGTGTYTIQSSYIENGSQANAEQTSSSHDRSRANEIAVQKQLTTQFGMSEKQAASLSKGITATEQIQGKIGTGIAAALGVPIASFLAKAKGSPLSAIENKKLDSAVASAQEKAITQQAAKDPGFVDKLMGNAGKDAQAEAAGTVIEVGGALLTAGLVAGEVFTGAGVVATPATVAGMGVATSLAKTSLMSKIKSGSVEGAKGSAGATKELFKGQAGAALFAKGIANGASAMASATLQDASKKDFTNATEKSLSKTNSISASEADKIADSLKTSETKTSGRTNSLGQTRTAAVTLDRDQIFRVAVNGVGETSGEELMAQAATNSVALRAFKSPQAVAAADREVAMATMGRTAQDFGGGTKGQQIADYEKNVLFEHFLTGQVQNSMMNTKAHALIGGSVETVTTPAKSATKGHWVDIPKGQLAAQPSGANKSSALADWANVDPAVPENVNKAKSSGRRWVSGTAAQGEKTSLAPRDSDSLQYAPVPTANLGSNVGNSPAFKRVAQTVIPKADANNQQLYDHKKPANQELELMAPGALAKHDEHVSTVINEIAAVAAVGAVANVVSSALGSNNQGTPTSVDKTVEKKPEASGKPTPATPSSPATNPSNGRTGFRPGKLRKP